MISLLILLRTWRKHFSRLKNSLMGVKSSH
ncbi:hypothetical protein Goari_023678 [Gossypium aridum]|uniref:Uncharacterized protein n=1 Tax=Gossypium aridum TaxID=34290 RepID=A0A7J8X3R7_GOSAI|nr:hypothetical protein [Gossypium aridum]